MIDAPHPKPSSPLRVFLPWSIVACLALACAGLVQLYLSSRAETELFRNQAALADLELRSARQQLEAERLLAHRERTDAAHLASLQIIPVNLSTDTTAPVTAIVIWNSATQEGLLHVDHLPPTAPGHSYRLQAIDPANPEPIDLAVVETNAQPARIQFRPTKPLPATPRFTLTGEPRSPFPRN